MREILQILGNPMVISGLLLALPVLLLILYVLLDRVAPHTQSQLDDEARAAVAEILAGLGKPVPEHVEPKEAKRRQDVHDGLAKPEDSSDV